MQMQVATVIYNNTNFKENSLSKSNVDDRDFQKNFRYFFSFRLS